MMSLRKRVQALAERPHSWFCSQRRMTWQQQQRPHLDIGQWLNGLDLPEYATCFKKNQGVEDILYLDEADIKALGVKNGAHRAQIVSSLVILRSKYEKSTGPRNKRGGLQSPSSIKCFVVKDPLKYPYPYQESQDSLFICVPNNRKTPISFGKCGMEPVADPNASPQQLRKALEWELSLDNRDLRSHAWYHGSIPRGRAEELIAQDGDFLIRDCISQPGDFVLTCRWKGCGLHFVVNKMVLQPNTVYERIQYQLEDDSYDTVPDLVTCYVGSGKPISSASGAKIARPINRSMPLSFYATHYGNHFGSESDLGSRSASPLPSLGSASPIHTPLSCTPNSSPPAQRRQTLSDKHKTMATPPSVKDDYGKTRTNELMSLSSMDDRDLQRMLPHNRERDQLARRQQHLIRAGSEPMLSPRLERRSATASAAARWVTQAVNIQEPESVEDVPPPKPSRTPSVKYSRRPYAVVAPTYPDALPSGNATNNESDSGNGSGDSIHSADILLASSMTLGSVKRRPCVGYDRRWRPNSDTRFSFLDPKSASTDGGSSEGGDSAFDEEPTVTLPLQDPPSCFDLGAEEMAYLLPASDNKPLDGTAWNKVCSLLLECGSRVIAAHLTRVDLEVLRASGDADLGLGVTTGVELLTLPQGRRLRLDLMERTNCMKLFVSVTILHCLNESERAALLRKWIEIAIDTKTSLGNLYSFTGIMLGLGSPQIQRLKSTWNSLRLSCTDIALTYETKLRPILKFMNECTNPQAPNTTIPYLLPLIIAVERSMEELEESLTAAKCTFPWEQSSSDYGTNLLFCHLEIGRSYIKQWGTFKRNGEIALENVAYEPILLTMFRTEFHQRFLWGSKGAWVEASERHNKFEQVLAVLSERCESG